MFERAKTLVPQEYKKLLEVKSQTELQDEMRDFSMLRDLIDQI